YGVWDQATWLPEDIRLVLAMVLAVIGVLFALLRPGDRPLDEWLLAGLLFVMLPRRLVWRPGAVLLRQTPREQAGWAELELHPEWLATEADGQLETPGPVSRRPLALWRFNRLRSPFSKASQNQFTHRRWHW